MPFVHYIDEENFDDKLKEWTLGLNSDYVNPYDSGETQYINSNYPWPANINSLSSKICEMGLIEMDGVEIRSVPLHWVSTVSVPTAPSSSFVFNIPSMFQECMYECHIYNLPPDAGVTATYNAYFDNNFPIPYKYTLTIQTSADDMFNNQDYKIWMNGTWGRVFIYLKVGLKSLSFQLSMEN